MGSGVAVPRGFTQMSIDRHLGALSALAADLRLQLAEILLDWLVTGDAVSQIAERQGVPMNTGYSRLSRARGLVGEDALSDAPRRFEITIALYSMVPLWRGQAGE